MQWIIAGDGRMAEVVKKDVVDAGLAERFQFLGQLPSEVMPELFEKADALLVSLAQAPVFELTVPGKVQSYLAAGKPILAMIDGEAARVISEAGAGFTCRAGDSLGLARIVIQLARKSIVEREQLGASGRRYAFREFPRERLFDQLEAWFLEATEEMARRY